MVITEDKTGTPLENLKVYRNDIYEGLSDSFGQKTFTYDEITCHKYETFKITCQDNTICSTKKADLDKLNDFSSIIFDCSICTTEKDLTLKKETLIIGENNISINVSSLGISGNAEISLYLQESTGLRGTPQTDTISLNLNSETKHTFTNLVDLAEFFHFK